MPGQKLVIVESPTKARTIRKYLGDEFRVEASMGHVRDLPAGADEIPKDIKKKSWSRLGVDVENDFQPVYVIPRDKKKVVSELKKALKNADELFLATDEDREGESIGWHLVQVLKPKVPTRRMVFHEITPEAIQRALEKPREIDEKLVQAQETRRVLDRLVGYVVSPLLWKKVAPKLSAGRVQSVAVRILVLRERERMAFVSGSYWDLKALLDRSGNGFDAQMIELDGTRIATGRDFDENTGKIIDGRNVVLLDEKTAKLLLDNLEGRPIRVASVEKKQSTRKPYAPFTTSTLQQEANRKLGWTARRTMQVAQRLYENGHITYMRTDSVNLSDQAVTAARSLVAERYGSDYLSPKPRRFQTKAKGAQEAHEAIRPAGSEMRPAQEINVSGDEARLYDLIWKRTVATQMGEARIEHTSVRFEVTEEESGQVATFRSSGREVLFPGFLRAYVEGSDDPEAALDDQSAPLPPLVEGQDVDCKKLEAVGHETKPPARFTEATLVKTLEEMGIGRPSTYATIIDTVQARGYVRTEGRQLIPTFTAMAVTGLLESTHRDVVDTDFTADMEKKLDAIADGGGAENFLAEFYNSELLKGVEEGASLDPREVCTIVTDKLHPYRIRVGKYGPYVEKDVENAEKPETVSLPDGTAPADLDRQNIDELFQRAKEADEPLGTDPDSGEFVYLLDGRYGPYLQLGEVTDDNKKPKRASLPKGLERKNVDLQKALDLLALPRVVGPHPEDGKSVNAGIGRYGPYVEHNRKYASLTKTDDVLTVGLDRAVELLAKKKKRGGAEPLREVGKHPEDGEPVNLFEGRYGPYVKHGKVNASLPKGTDPDGLTLEAAVELIAKKKAAPKKKRTSRRKKK